MINDKCQVPLILLAAGESKRMGTPKQLLTYNGLSLIRHAVIEAIESKCEPIVVVLGANRDRIDPEIKDLKVHITHNHNWQQGMSASIAAGIDTLLMTSINFDAVIVALGDQPFVTSQTYNLLTQRYYQNQVKAVASNYSNTIGVPALFDRTLISELFQMKQQGGAKQLLKHYSDRRLNLNLPEAAIDIDTPADYLKLLKL